MSDEVGVQLDDEELRAAVTVWRAAVPPVVAHPPIPIGASDPASTLAAQLCVAWPEMDAARDAHRVARADKFHGAEMITGTDLDIADAENAQRFNGLTEEV
jgi:hypothetical protein